MPTLTVRVAPSNRGTVDIKVWTYIRPGPTLNWHGIATSDNPIDQTWNDLGPGYFAITISWYKGYQNIGGGPGHSRKNSIIYNGIELYYQILGMPADESGISATFGVHLV
jgi:hypothetical protein